MDKNQRMKNGRKSSLNISLLETPAATRSLGGNRVPNKHDAKGRGRKDDDA